MGIALAAMLTVGTSDDEERRRREAREREAREPKPAPIPDPPQHDHAALLARDAIGSALVAVRDQRDTHASVGHATAGAMDAPFMRKGHPPEVQAMIDAEEREHRERIIARNNARQCGHSHGNAYDRWEPTVSRSREQTRRAKQAARAAAKASKA
jgi:hypothetical protein